LKSPTDLDLLVFGCLGEDLLPKELFGDSVPKEVKGFASWRGSEEDLLPKELFGNSVPLIHSFIHSFINFFVKFD